MGTQPELQALLAALPGVAKAYFQPPSNLQMVYPCIVYQLDFMDSQFADNVPYRVGTRYQLTIIDRDPTSQIRFAVAKLPKTAFDRFFVANNLNHTVFTIHF